MIKKISCVLLTFSVCVICATTPQWTPDQSKRVLSAVTSTANIRLVSKKHPQSEADAMGISSLLKIPNLHIARFQLSCILLAQANVDCAPFEQSNCPEAAQIAYLHYCTKEKNPRLLEVLESRYKGNITNNCSGFFRGYYATKYADTADYIAAAPFFQSFLKWHLRSTSPFIGCFTDDDLARAHTALGLFYQRQENKQALMEDHLKRARALQPNRVYCLHNLADCYMLMNNTEEEARYRQLATDAEQRTGASAIRDGVSINLQLPSGGTFPFQHVRARGADAQRVEQKGISQTELQRRLDDNPELQARVLRGLLQEYVNLTPTQFAQTPDSHMTLKMEIQQVPYYDDENQKFALKRINDRLPLVALDRDLMCSMGELFKSIAGKHPSEVSQLKGTIRLLVTQLAAKGAAGSPSMSYLSGVEGLGEEVAYIYRQKMKVALDTPIACRMREDIDGVATYNAVFLDPLHRELLGELNKQQRPPAHVLRTLKQAGIVENSALYIFWQAEWQKTWGQEQEARRAASAKQEQVDHEEFWAAVPPVVNPSIVPGSTRSGPAVCAPDGDDLPKSATAVAPGFDSHAVFTEAERAAKTNDYALPKNIGLELKVETASGGSGSVQILYERTNEKKRELARYRPHVHYNFNEQESKSILYQYYLLQKNFHETE